MNGAAIFSISYNSRILFHDWAEECVVCHVASGETHLLESTAAHLLQIIASSPTTAQILKDSLVNLFGDEAVDELEDYLSKTLTHFQEMGLINQARE